MKKLLPILALFLTLSCEKPPEPTGCYECITYSGSEPLSTITVCAFTDTEIKLYEVGLQDQATALTQNPCVTVCRKK